MHLLCLLLCAFRFICKGWEIYKFLEKLSKVVTRICDPDKVKYVFERGAFSMLLLCAFRFIPKGLEIPIFLEKLGKVDTSLF